MGAGPQSRLAHYAAFQLAMNLSGWCAKCWSQCDAVSLQRKIQGRCNDTQGRIRSRDTCGASDWLGRLAAAAALHGKVKQRIAIRGCVSGPWLIRAEKRLTTDRRTSLIPGAGYGRMSISWRNDGALPSAGTGCSASGLRRGRGRKGQTDLRMFHRESLLCR